MASFLLPAVAPIIGELASRLIGSGIVPPTVGQHELIAQLQRENDQGGGELLDVALSLPHNIGGRRRRKGTTRRKKRAPSAYNRFVAKERRKGRSMAQIGAMWRGRGLIGGEMMDDTGYGGMLSGFGVIGGAKRGRKKGKARSASLGAQSTYMGHKLIDIYAGAKEGIPAYERLKQLYELERANDATMLDANFEQAQLRVADEASRRAEALQRKLMAKQRRDFMKAARAQREEKWPQEADTLAKFAQPFLAATRTPARATFDPGALASVLLKAKPSKP